MQPSGQSLNECNEGSSALLAVDPKMEGQDSRWRPEERLGWMLFAQEQ